MTAKSIQLSKATPDDAARFAPLIAGLIRATGPVSYGYRELQLDVLAANPAVGFYQANGLRILAETRSPELSRDHAFPSEYRMAVTL